MFFRFVAVRYRRLSKNRNNENKSPHLSPFHGTFTSANIVRNRTPETQPARAQHKNVTRIVVFIDKSRTGSQFPHRLPNRSSHRIGCTRTTGIYKEYHFSDGKPQTVYFHFCFPFAGSHIQQHAHPPPRTFAASGWPTGLAG